MMSYTDEKLKNEVSPEMLDAKAVSPCMDTGISVDQAIRIFDRMDVENWYSLQEAWKAIKADRARLQAEVAELLWKRSGILEGGIFIGGPNAECIVFSKAHVEPAIAAMCMVTGDDNEDYTATPLDDYARAKKGDV